MTVASITPDQPFVGIAFCASQIDEVLDTMRARPSREEFVFAVTPNVDHVVRFHDKANLHRHALASAYRRATWRLCDSRVLAGLARVRGIALSVVAGSDLTARLFAEVIETGDTICIVGGDFSTIPVLQPRHPGVTFVQHRPPMELRNNVDALCAAALFVEQAHARFTFLAVGSPQQEMLADIVAERGRATGIGLCIGAGIAFLTGDLRRAPLWMQRIGIEWLHRLMSDPSRLWRRYLLTGPKIFRIALSGSNAVETE